MPKYSSGYRFELPLDGAQSGTWGQMMNTFMGTLLEDALSGGARTIAASYADVNTLQYRINSGTWVAYSAGFSLSSGQTVA
jgi:hypothetical protein